MDHFNFDLKFVLPALVNFGLYLFNRHKAKLWLPFDPAFNLDWKIWLFSIVILVLFLITSVTLPLSVTGRIRIGIANHISFFFAITLVSSVFLPEPIFCVGYVVILFISPWHDFLWRLLKCFLFSIWDVLSRIPGVIITCNVENNQQDHEGETNPPPLVEGVAVDIEMGGNGILPEQPPSEPVTTPPPPPPVEYVAVDIEMGGNAILPEPEPEPIAAAVVQP